MVQESLLKLSLQSKLLVQMLDRSEVCFDDRENTIKTARALVCEDLGGTWDNTNQHCTGFECPDKHLVGGFNKDGLICKEVALAFENMKTWTCGASGGTGGGSNSCGTAMFCSVMSSDNTCSLTGQPGGNWSVKVSGGKDTGHNSCTAMCIGLK